jgi:C4-type Zn-finger protein
MLSHGEKEERGKRCVRVLYVVDIVCHLERGLTLSLDDTSGPGVASLLSTTSHRRRTSKRDEHGLKTRMIHSSIEREVDVYK